MIFFHYISSAWIHSLKQLEKKTTNKNKNLLTCFWVFNTKVSSYIFSSFGSRIFMISEALPSVFASFGATLASQIATSINQLQMHSSSFISKRKIFPPFTIKLYPELHTWAEPLWCPWASFTDLMITCHLLIDLGLGSVNQLSWQEA